METAAPENGTIFERLRGRECPETLKEMATRVHGMLKKTFTGQDIRVDYSEEKKNRPFVEDMENYLLHAQSGSLLTRLDVGCFREVTTAMYETLCKYGRGRLPTINPTRSKEIHEGLIEFQ